jgi:hypothetical protein
MRNPRDLGRPRAAEHSLCHGVLHLRALLEFAQSTCGALVDLVRWGRTKLDRAPTERP